MNTKRNLVGLIICELVTLTSQSIAGVTYRDHFDFEERYRHDECNPLYWHPLHMPDHCTEMYEKLIRSQLYNTYPYKRKQNMKDQKSIKKLKRLLSRRRQKVSSESYDVSDESSKYAADSSSSKSQSCSDHVKDSGDCSSYEVQYEFVTEESRKENRQPYQVMLNMIKEDVMNLPAMPVIGVLPSLGLATIYRQPVSKKTEKTIKKMAGAYASAAQETYMEAAANFFPPPYPHLPEPSSINNTNVEKEDKLNRDSNKRTFPINKDPDADSNSNKKTFQINKDPDAKIKLQIKKMMQHNHQKLKMNKAENEPKLPNRKKPQVQTKKIVNGNMVAYIQQKSYFG